jgi:hypothetical protein
MHERKTDGFDEDIEGFKLERWEFDEQRASANENKN